MAVDIAPARPGYTPADARAVRESAKITVHQLRDFGIIDLVPRIDVFHGRTTLFVLRRAPKYGSRANPHEIYMNPVDVLAPKIEDIANHTVNTNGHLRIIGRSPDLQPSTKLLIELGITHAKPIYSFDPSKVKL